MIFFLNLLAKIFPKSPLDNDLPTGAHNLERAAVI